jgi:KTSC domain
MTDITHEPVTSSNVKSTGYDPATKTFAVTFHSGSTYHYHNVTPEQAKDFHASDSKGKWVHQHLVVPHHPHTKQ